MDTPQQYLLVAARFGGLLLSAPFFSSRLVPFRLRLGLAAACVLCLAPLDGASRGLLQATPSDFNLLAPQLLAEGLVGVAIGWSAFLLMGAVRGAAMILSEQIGLSTGGIFDPLAAESDAALRSFHAMLAVFIFLGLDLHHVFLGAVSESLQLLPPGTLGGEEAMSALGKMVELAGRHLFRAVLALALPVVGLMGLVTVAQAVLARVLPELELLSFGFSLRSVFGLGLIVFSLPAIGGVCQGLLESASEAWYEVLR